MSPQSDGRSAEPGLAVLPQRLDDLFGIEVACSCGRTHQVSMRGASVRPGALDDLPDWVSQLGRGLNICLVVDQRTRQIAGERVFELLSADGHKPRWCVVPDGAGGRPHADESNLELVEGALDQVDLALAVGSGTLNDLAKLSSYRRGLPYMVAATAASMNGYTSAIAAVMIKGVKRTVDCHQPVALVADLDIISQAPPELTASGLGDLESKPTATADYRLAGRLRGDYYCSAPEGVVLAAEARVADAAEGIGRADPQALSLLTEALLLSGLSMKLAGSSSPASGGEHLISHHWDMNAAREGRVEGWHGAQVGVATITTAALYELLSEQDPTGFDLDRLVAERPDEQACRERIAAAHGDLAAEVTREFLSKRLSDEGLRTELEGILSGWTEMWSSLSDVLRPPSRIRSILDAGGSATSMSQLGLSPDHLRTSLHIAREIRGRFTVLDLAAELGVLPSQADAVLSRCGCLA